MTKCLYICGAGHSGSTLLDMLLGSHSRIASLGEIINLPMDWATNNRCTCGANMHDCELWSNVVHEFELQYGIDVTVDPYSLNLGPIYAVVGDKRVTGRVYRLRRRFISALHYLELRSGMFGLLRPMLRGTYDGLENNLALFEIIGRRLGVDYVVDSSKVYMKAVGLYKMAPEAVRIILLIRDGRAVYYSMRKRGFNRQFSLNSWYNHFRRALPLVEQHVDPAHVLIVKYEDLATDPAKELQRICMFAGLEFELAMLDFRSKVHHNVNGNDSRFSTVSEIRLDVSWKENLSWEDKQYFLDRAGWLNEKLGYR